MDIKTSIERMREALGELEQHARALPNQNVADIIASARGKLAQVCEHADLEKAGKSLEAAYHEAMQLPSGEQKPFPGLPANVDLGGGQHGGTDVNAKPAE